MLTIEEKESTNGSYELSSSTATAESPIVSRK
jgi:hypothetical protein